MISLRLGRTSECLAQAQFARIAEGVGHRQPAMLGQIPSIAALFAVVGLLTAERRERAFQRLAPLEMVHDAADRHMGNRPAVGGQVEAAPHFIMRRDLGQRVLRFPARRIAPHLFGQRDVGQGKFLPDIIHHRIERAAGGNALDQQGIHFLDAELLEVGDGLADPVMRHLEELVGINGHHPLARESLGERRHALALLGLGEGIVPQPRKSHPLDCLDLGHLFGAPGPVQDEVELGDAELAIPLHEMRNDVTVVLAHIAECRNSPRTYCSCLFQSPASLGLQLSVLIISLL